MRIADVVRSGLLICLSFSTGVLESQTANLSTTERMAQADAKHKRSEAGLPLSVLRDLPLQFEENKGQAPGNARFLARGAGYTLLLNADGLDLNLRPRGNTTRRLSMHLLGARTPNLLGREQTATQTNYYIGRDPRDWHLGVRSYRSVVYEGVYKGIDLIYHGSGSQLEYDFVISPGSDPALIRMRFEGLMPRSKGKDLSFEGEDKLSVRALKAFQILDGQKKEVDVAWEIKEDQVSIRLGSYERTQELIIDPVFFYGVYIGGDSDDAAISVVPASQPGYFYVALSTDSAKIEQPTELAANPKCASTPNNCPTDVLILGINATSAPAPPSPLPDFGHGYTPTATIVVGSATYIGSTTGSTIPTAMVGDQNFNLYIAGKTTDGATFPQLGTQPCSQSCVGFVAMLSTSLNASANPASDNVSLRYSFGLPATPLAIAVDQTGDAYLTGFATRTSGGQMLTIKSKDMAFPSLIASAIGQTTSPHAFLLELDPQGSTVFCSYIGGSGIDQGNAIAVSGNSVFIAGQTSSPDFPTTAGAYKRTPGGGQDAFVLGANNLATSPNLIFSTYLGGAATDTVASIALAPSGNIVVAGSTNSTQFPIQSSPSFSIPSWPLKITTIEEDNPPYMAGDQIPALPNTPPILTPLPTAVPAGSQDAFVTSFSPDGSQLLFTDFLGADGVSNSVTTGQAVTVDSVGVIYIVGASSATGPKEFLSGFATGDGQSFSPPPPAVSNVFFGEIDPSGKYLLEATIAGGSGTDSANSLIISSSLATAGTVTIVGTTTAAPDTTNGNPDLFLSASISEVDKINPAAPDKIGLANTTGFFVQEALAGYCDMQLVQQTGFVLKFSGPCVSGTQSGSLFVTAANVKNGPALLPLIPITMSASGTLLSGSVTVDVSSLGGQALNFSFGFLPLGAIGGTGPCQNNTVATNGCGIVTGGGGAGTIFNVQSGTLAVALSCSGPNCTNGNTVLVGQPVTLNAVVTNGLPNTVKWSSSGGSFSSSDPSTSVTFIPGGTGGQVVITATPVADTSVSPAPTITLNTIEPTSVSFANNGPFTYGQTNITINVSSSAGSSSTPTGNITYQVDGGPNGTLTLSGGSVPIQLASLSAGTHSLAVSYPGDPASFLANSSNTLNFTVNKALLTVTATSPPPVTFGQAIPALTYATPTGFANGEGVSVISGTATLSTTATSTSAPGDYPITFSTMALAAANYSFNYVNGTLTISPVGAAPAPIISPAGGSYTSPQTAAITSSVAGAKFYYTTDGTAPTETSASYTGPIAVSASETIRAIAIAVGYQTSAISNATFNLLPPTLSAPSISFGSIVQGVLSGTRSIVLTNPGANAISGLALKLGGANASEFTLTSGTTCGTTLAANSSCSVVGAFTPASTGTRSAALAISYSGIGSPLVLSLEGIGASPLSVISSATQLVAGTTFQFTASGPAIWTASAGTISSSGFFTSPNPAPAPTQITVTATSTSNAQISATTQVTIFPVPAIVVPSTVTLPAGGSVSVPMSIVSGTGIAGEAMTLACAPATLPTGVSCFFTPNPIVDAGGATVTLQLFSNNSVKNNSPTRTHPWGEYPPNGFTVVVAGCILGFGRKKYGGRMMMVLILVLGSAAFLSLTACGTSTSLNGTTQGGHVTGTYTINISVSGASPGAADYNQTLTTVPLKVILQ